MNDFGSDVRCPKCKTSYLQPTQSKDGAWVYICACGYGKDLLQKLDDAYDDRNIKKSLFSRLFCK